MLLRRMPVLFLLAASGCCFGGGGPYELELGRSRAGAALRCPIDRVAVVDTEPHGATFAGCGRSVRLHQHCEYADVGCSWYTSRDVEDAAARYRRSRADE
jgi:hypothetical protein